MTTSRRDSGQAAVLTIALAVVVLASTHGLVRVGSAIIDRARADGVADAVALAVASGRSDVISALVRNTQATVASLNERDGDVIVQVRVGASLATARATTNW